MTILIRKYYNQAISFDHRRTWLQKGKQKEELREENLQDPNQGQRKNQNPSQNLEVRKNPLVDMLLAFQAEQKLLNKFLAKVP